MENDFDYRRIFNENISAAGSVPNEQPKQENHDKSEKRKLKEKKYIATFFIQSLVCILIIGSIIVAKYTTPKTFVSVSSVLNGLYENNVTLSDLNRLIDEKLLGNETLAAFFNMSGK